VSGLLILEVALFGTAALWLLAVIPAMVITILKGQTRKLGWGFLTAGFTWFAAALTLAPSDSRWAKRHYTEEERARAKLPFREQRSRKTFLTWNVCAIVLIAGLGFFAARPAPFLGVDGAAIGNDMPHRGGGVFFEFWPELGPCAKTGPGKWGCSLYDTEGSGGTVFYEVKVHRLGCWTAKPTQSPQYGYGRLSGCLSVFDYL
jgi:hypothetical protein